MSVSIPKPVTEDWRDKLARDDAKQRKIRLKNIDRDNKQADILFKEKQQKLYNNVVDVFPTEKLGTFIQEQSIISRDVRNNIETAKQKSRQVSANQEVVDFIVERLSQDELNYLLVNFNKILTKLRKTNTKLDKDLFIQFIRKEALENPVNSGDDDDNDDDVGNDDRPAPGATPDRPTPPTAARSPPMRFFDANDFESSQDVEAANIRSEQQSLREELNDINAAVQEALQNAAARTRLQEEQDSRLTNADDSAPVRAGNNSGILNQEVNPSTPQNVTISPANTPLSSNEERVRQRLEQFRPRESPPRRRSSRLRRQTGNGVISGRGLQMQSKSIQNRHYIGKFYIEKHKLKDNLLSVKYSKNEVPPSQLRPRSISTALRGLIEDVIADKYNERVYHMLEDDDKRLFKKFVKVLKLPIDTYDDLDKEYQKNYELLKGQFMSGNNSPEIKSQLRKYIVEGMNEGKLNRSESMFLLYQLSL